MIRDADWSPMPDDFVAAAPALVVQTRAEVLALPGRSLGPSLWFTIDQDRVDQFAALLTDPWVISGLGGWGGGRRS